MGKWIDSLLLLVVFVVWGWLYWVDAQGFTKIEKLPRVVESVITGISPTSVIESSIPQVLNSTQQGDSSHSIPSVGGSTTHFLPELEITKEKQPSQACSLYGPVEEKDLQGLHKSMETFQMRSKFLLHPTDHEEQLTLLTGPYQGEKLEQIKKILSDNNLAYAEEEKAGGVVLVLGKYKDVATAQISLNNINRRLSGYLAVTLERQELSHPGMVNLIFVNLSPEEFEVLNRWVQHRHQQPLKGCPY